MMDKIIKKYRPPDEKKKTHKMRNATKHAHQDVSSYSIEYREAIPNQ